ncbi:sensor histidine kinase [Aquabacter spiritensis]|uniref:histidine kinase n=1 Tax=Aquabacter spiritensis TaxID=933073 RepID=A0A4R3LY10_9HYPH|nr:HAMP domain-containing sensor histidine kinase [Aquabacter spiritensis]TCT03547.1 cell cycle sensor histidine kinase DivJ [Aquabacter spiritensis]
MQVAGPIGAGTVPPSSGDAARRVADVWPGLRAAPPDQLAPLARVAARALGGLGAFSAGAGGLVLLAEGAGLVTGAVPEAGWLIACGLVCGALAAVSAGLARAAARMEAGRQDAGLALETLHKSGGETVRILAARAAFADLPADALAGAGIFERIHVADRPAFLSALAAAIGDKRERSVELRLRSEPAGAAPDFAWMEVRVADAGQGLGRAFWRDVTAAREEAERAAAAQAEAERANDAKSRFLAAMSHELRTPLNSILGFSELLQEDAAGRMDPARRADYARIIHESGQHLLGLVNDILDLSRVEAGAYDLACEDLDMNALIAGCLEMMALEAERRSVTLSSSMPAILPFLSADQRAMRQIVLNLLSNAVKFTPAGGRVDVSAGVAAGALLVRVRDTGCGMASADLARIGEPFFQAGDMDHRRSGSGLGLAVVRGLVDLHKGRFDVSSVLGVGTTVSLAFPLCGPVGIVAPFERPGGRTVRARATDRRRA